MRMMILLSVWLSVTTLAQSLTAPNPAAPAGLAQLDWIMGEWDLVSKSKQRDGSYSSHKANSKVYYALDGFAIMDEFRALDDQNQVVFRGVSFRTFVPATGKWSIKWVMANESGMTDIVAEFKDGTLVMEGKGTDGFGPFLEKAVYFDISEDHYSFKLDRSYDGGQTWIEGMNLIEATRIK